jgi:L-asparaginase II
MLYFVPNIAGSGSTETLISRGQERMINPILVTLTRGALDESVHRGALAVVRPGGEVVCEIGDVSKPHFMRSAIKALQAIPLVESGAATAFGLNGCELALACASHNGEPEHLVGVRSLLAKCGLDEGALACGAQWPLGLEAARALAASGDRPRPIHNNCSGKHAGMLGVAAHRGQQTIGYEQQNHPVQKSISEVLADMGGVELTPDLIGIDGCSVPTWALPLEAMARAFAKFGTGAELAPSRQAACRDLMAACFAEPFHVAGTGRFCTNVMLKLPDRAFVKAGAEGVYCASLPESGLGVALKIDDGAKRAAEAVMVAALEALLPGPRENLAGVWDGRLTNWRGATVGQTRVSAELLNALKSTR